MKSAKSISMVSSGEALPGRAQALSISNQHFVSGNPIQSPFPEYLNSALFGMGCFWGAERKFWQLDGVFSTSVGYSAGYTPNPTYQEVCSGMTGHNEVVLVVYDPKLIEYQQLLQCFWESHNPTQGMQQGNDIGTQYRSGIYYFDEYQEKAAKLSQQHYQSCLQAEGLGAITTEITQASEFYYAEEYHQQYLAKTPGGYCGIGGVGVPYILE